MNVSIINTTIIYLQILIFLVTISIVASVDVFVPISTEAHDLGRYVKVLVPNKREPT